MKKLTQEEADRRDLRCGAIRTGKFTTVQTKTEYICKICNKMWFTTPERVWLGERGHHGCVVGKLDYDSYKGKTVNNCTLGETKRVYGPNNKRRKESYIYIENQCIICGKRRVSSAYNILICGVGCCTKQKYDTLDVEILFNTLYKHHIFSAKKDNRITNINKSNYRHLIMQPCEYPGCKSIPLINKREDLLTTIKVNGVDRLDSNYGYDINSNIGVLCFGHNSMKTNFSENELVELEPKWADYFNKKRDYRLPLDF